MLEHGQPPLRDCRFLDLFAGSGAIGLEALSRGAAELCLVEADRCAAAGARRNVEKHGETARTRLLVGDATRLPPAREPFAIAYLDPPYGSGLVPACLAALVAGGWLAAEALVVVEVAAREALAPPPGFIPLDERRYGAGRIVRLRFADGS
jgi:16S rRNA (guanine966-N2)-methyltransferase